MEIQRGQTIKHRANSFGIGIGIGVSYNGGSFRKQRDSVCFQEGDAKKGVFHGNSMTGSWYNQLNILGLRFISSTWKGLGAQFLSAGKAPYK